MNAFQCQFRAELIEAGRYRGLEIRPSCVCFRGINGTFEVAVAHWQTVARMRAPFAELLVSGKRSDFQRNLLDLLDGTKCMNVKEIINRRQEAICMNFEHRQADV